MRLNRFAAAASIALLAGLLAACGNKGPLVKPAPAGDAAGPTTPSPSHADAALPPSPHAH